MQKFDHLGSKIFSPIDNGGEVPKLGMYLTDDGGIGFAINGANVLTIAADGSFIPGDLAGLVEALQPFYAVAPPAVNIVASGTTTVMVTSEFEVQVDKSVSASHTVTLPPSPVNGQIARVSDGKGDLSDAVTITVQGAAGKTINGEASHVMNYAWGCATYRYNGTQWNIVGLV